jgi:sulfur carrier protein
MGMQIKVNGKPHNVEKAENISAILNHFNITQTAGVAVALNDSVVPKNDFDKVIVRDGDAIEIIRAVQGG